MKTALKFRDISVDEFNTYFYLDSPGYFLAKEAHEAGELGTALDTLETICLVNKLYDMELRNHIAEELKHYGKTVEYFEKYGTQEGTDLALQTLGAARMSQILREVMDDVRRQSKIGTGENDKPTTP